MFSDCCGFQAIHRTPSGSDFLRFIRNNSPNRACDVGVRTVLFKGPLKSPFVDNLWLCDYGTFRLGVCDSCLQNATPGTQRTCVYLGWNIWVCWFRVDLQVCFSLNKVGSERSQKKYNGIARKSLDKKECYGSQNVPHDRMVWHGIPSRSGDN